MNQFLSLTLADRLALTLEGLARAVAACSDRRRVGGALATWLITLVWRRVKRTEVRLQDLLRRFRAGTLRVRASAVAVERIGVRRGGGRRGAVKGVPQRFAWLLPLVPCEAANFASQLRATLQDPEMVALLGVSLQARRILAPVCRMLGIEAALLMPAPPPLEAATPQVAATTGFRLSDPVRPSGEEGKGQGQGALPSRPPARAGPFEPFWLRLQTSRDIIQVD